MRYWPSIAQEGSSTEISAELNGQECCSLTEVPGVGCLLATTTATLLLIHHTRAEHCLQETCPAYWSSRWDRKEGFFPALGSTGRWWS